MLTYKIHLIRHGLTRGNLEGRYIGRTDLPLCPEGRARLEKLRESCEYPWADVVCSSPMLRARETAQLLYPNRPLEVVEDLRELDFGDFEGRTIRDLEADPAFRAWVAAPATQAAPHGESSAELAARAQDAVARIFARMMEKRITSAAVITHGGLIMNLLAAMGLPQREAVRWSVESGRGYTCLLSAQMWMRDHKFEVYEQIPYEPLETACEQELPD